MRTQSANRFASARSTAWRIRITSISDLRTADSSSCTVLGLGVFEERGRESLRTGTAPENITAGFLYDLVVFSNRVGCPWPKIQKQKLCVCVGERGQARRKTFCERILLGLLSMIIGNIYLFFFFLKAIGSIRWEDINLAKQTGVSQVVFFSSVFWKIAQFATLAKKGLHILQICLSCEEKFMQTFFFDITNLLKGFSFFWILLVTDLGVGIESFGEHYLGFHLKLMKNSWSIVKLWL